MIIGNGRLISNDPLEPYIENGGVLIDGNTIRAVGDFQTLKGQFPHEAVYDVRGRLIMPGMINAHTHIYSAFARGFGPSKPTPNFLKILENMWWHLDKELTEEDNRYSAYAAMSESIRLGVTTLIDHHASPHAVPGSLFTLAEAAKDLGIRASLCYETSDRDGVEIARQGIAENVRFIKYCGEDKTDMIKGLFGLHASFTLSDQTLLECREAMAGLDSGFHIHVAEGTDDEEDAVKNHGMRVVERLNQFDILGPKTIAVHCVHANEAELEIIKATDTTVVHNPESNMGNAVGYSPVVRMLDKGIRVGLGTDAYTNDMFESLKVAKILQSHALGDPTVGFSHALKLQFDNNPRILQNYFNQPLGVLKAGAYADLIVLGYDPVTPLNDKTMGGHILFGMAGYQVEDSMINGRFVMKDRVILTVDHAKIMAETRRLSQKLWDRL